MSDAEHIALSAQLLQAARVPQGGFKRKRIARTTARPGDDHKSSDEAESHQDEYADYDAREPMPPDDDPKDSELHPHWANGEALDQVNDQGLEAVAAAPAAAENSNHFAIPGKSIGELSRPLILAWQTRGKDSSEDNSSCSPQQPEWARIVCAAQNNVLQRAHRLLRRWDYTLVSLDASVLQHVLAPFLCDSDLNSVSSLSRALHSSTQPALARRKWWTALSEPQWQTGFRLRLCSDDDFAQLDDLAHVTHVAISPPKGYGYEREEKVWDDRLKHLKGMTHLQELSVTRCRITRGLMLVSSMTQLQELSLDCCDIAHQTVHFSSMTQLKRFHLDSCLLSDGCMTHLKKMTQLQHLKLVRLDHISDAGLEHLTALTQLKEFVLEECASITCAGLVHLKGMSKLQLLNVTGCMEVSGEWLLHVKGMSHLRHLSASYLANRHIMHLMSMTQLQKLCFRCRNYITDDGLVHMTGMTELRQLFLERCEITDVGLAQLKGLTRLQRLALDNCSMITGSGFMHFNNLTQLQELSLSCCARVCDDSLMHLTTIMALNKLKLTHLRQITDAGVMHLKRAMQLQSLYLFGFDQITDSAVADLKKSICHLKISLTLDFKAYCDARDVW